VFHSVAYSICGQNNGTLYDLFRLIRKKGSVMKISVSVEQIIVGVSVVFIIGGFTPLGNNIRIVAAKTLITFYYREPIVEVELL
jgi:hypothetical protein